MQSVAESSDYYVEKWIQNGESDLKDFLDTIGKDYTGLWYHKVTTHIDPDLNIGNEIPVKEHSKHFPFELGIKSFCTIVSNYIILAFVLLSPIFPDTNSAPPTQLGDTVKQFPLSN